MTSGTDPQTTEIVLNGRELVIHGNHRSCVEIFDMGDGRIALELSDQHERVSILLSAEECRAVVKFLVEKTKATNI